VLSARDLLDRRCGVGLWRRRDFTGIVRRTSGGLGLVLGPEDEVTLVPDPVEELLLRLAVLREHFGAEFDAARRAACARARGRSGARSSTRPRTRRPRHRRDRPRRMSGSVRASRTPTWPSGSRPSCGRRAPARRRRTATAARPTSSRCSRPSCGTTGCPSILDGQDPTPSGQHRLPRVVMVDDLPIFDKARP